MFEMWDNQDMGWSGCGVFRMWNVLYVICLGCEMLGVWDVRRVGCGIFAGMWDVDLRNVAKFDEKLKEAKLATTLDFNIVEQSTI